MEAEAISISDAQLPPEWQLYKEVYENRLRLLDAAHSGSWFGDHSSTYYEGLRAPPPGNSFDVEWGFVDALSSSGNQGWRVYSRDSLRRYLFDEIGEGILESTYQVAAELKQRLGNLVDQTIDVMNLANRLLGDDGISRYVRRVDREISAYAYGEYINARSAAAPRATRDSSQIMKGSTVPFHIQCYAALNAIKINRDRAAELASVVRSAIEIMTIATSVKDEPSIPRRVFIGHGRSPIWRELKDFLSSRLGLEFDEFNRVPTAGIGIQERLNEMLGECGFAFLLLTAEDIHQDNSKHARENVIHEAGLFQGRLGWRRAIVLLEEGCEEFTNIVGLGQVRFPAGRISAAFEDVRAVLEREGLLVPSR